MKFNKKKWLKQKLEKTQELKNLYKLFMEKKTIKDIIKISVVEGNKHSLRNRILCFLQADRMGLRDYQGHVKGFNQFKTDGIEVKKGSKALKILIPIIKKIETENIEDDSDDETRTFFKIGNVFDISQTNDENYLKYNAEKDKKLYTNTIDLDFKKTFRIIRNNFKFEIDINQNNERGSYNIETHQIKMKSESTHTLLHEFGHYLTRDIEQDYAKGELFAEITAYILSKKLGSKMYNFNYSNIWSNRIEDLKIENFENVFLQIEEKISKLNLSEV